MSAVASRGASCGSHGLYRWAIPFGICMAVAWLSVVPSPLSHDRNTDLEELLSGPTVVVNTSRTSYDEIDSNSIDNTDPIAVNSSGHAPYPFFTKFKHISREESLAVLTDLGSHDKYADASLRCIKATYRTPELYWYDYTPDASQKLLQQTNVTQNEKAGENTFLPIRRLLIVQSAGFGTYAQLLDATAPINKAYARKWGHTVLILQGSLVWLKQEKKEKCNPPEHRSTHNKMQLLKFGLRLKEHYDYLLILDADAMIYDFAKDLSDLMPPKAILAANRAVPKKGVKKRATWKINAGVTLWNLHHPLTQVVAAGWTKAAMGYLNGRNNNQGDQLFLYHVLKNNATLEANVFAVSKDFNYNKGTVIKHIKRPHVTYEIGQTSLDSRSELIAQFTQEICVNFPDDCESLDQTPYSTF